LKTTVLLDIDSTVFDTSSYKRSLADALRLELGFEIVSEFEITFRKALQSTLQSCSYFDPGFFIKEMYEVRRRDTTLEVLDKIFWSDTLFTNKLYPDVIDFLTELSSNDTVHLAIHSTGDLRHQRRKIQEILHFFKDENINIFRDKIAVIENTLKQYSDDDVIIIDDREDVLRAAKLVQKNIQTVLVVREMESLPKSEEFSMVSNSLSDIITLID